MHIHFRNANSLSQACQLAKDIKHSLNLSTEYKLTSKIWEYSKCPYEDNTEPNTQTTKDPTGNSVISPLSKVPKMLSISGVTRMVA